MARVYTILIADDDSDVRELAANILREPGYTVLTAGDGFEAIRILADRHIDLLVADMRMPELDGVQLGIQAKVMRPYLHVVYMTGFADSAAKVRNAWVIRKPIRAAELLRIVKEEMSAV